MPTYKKFIYNVTLCLICLGVFGVYLSRTGLGANANASLIKMMEGTADMPFQSRVLLPGIVKAVTRLLPADLFAQSKLPFADVAIQNLSDQNPANALPAWLAVFVMFFSLMGAVVMLPVWMRKLGYREKSIALWGMIYPITFMFFFFGAYLYDFPQLFLFSVALWALMPPKSGETQPFYKWLVYLLFFGLATLNKETSFVLILAYLVVYFRILNRERWIGLAVAQGVIYAAIRFYLLRLYTNNPGGIVEYHWPFYMENPLALLLVVVPFVLVGFFIAKGWAGKPLFLRQALVTGIPLIPLYFLFGYPFEMRVFLEIYPVVFLLLISPKAIQLGASAV